MNAIGRVPTTTFCIEFRWGWLLLYAAVLLVSIGLLVAVVLSGYSTVGVMPMWKMSRLPFLLYEMVDRPPLGDIVDENELERFVEEFGRKKFAVDGPVGFVGKGVDEARPEKGSGGISLMEMQTV